ncbi:MAG TPA: type II toxin-antitoxin system VapC family toxin [Chthoniobacterales bacterium]|nr:type II toxin-antitoxin system VapC family toxin [Chthoniobacterales bacterium]
MNGFLLDTNVVSELRKKERCNRNVDAWAASIPPNRDFLSVLVVGELTRGASLKRRTDPDTADAMEKWIGRLTQLYSDRILPVTLEVAEEWGRLSALRSLPPQDGLLAATAVVHRLTWVTRNVRNVEGLDVPILDPWS